MTAKILKNSLKNEVLDYVSTEEGQKFIFTIGAIFANGAKAGMGLNKKGGRFGFTELMSGIAGNWLQGLFGGIMGPPANQEGPPALEQQKGLP